MKPNDNVTNNIKKRDIDDEENEKTQRKLTHTLYKRWYCPACFLLFRTRTQKSGPMPLHNSSFYLKTQLFTMFGAEEKISPTNTMNKNRKVKHVDNGNNQQVSLMSSAIVPNEISPPTGQG